MNTPIFISIYELSFEDGTKYIGYTKLPLKKRLYGHLRKFGKNISISEIDRIDISENPRKLIKECESFWIAQYKQWGFILKNKNDGGGGPLTHQVTPETRAKISKSLTGKSFYTHLPMSDEIKKKISKSNSGKTLTKEHILNLSKAKTGTKASMETKLKMSKIRSGKTYEEIFGEKKGKEMRQKLYGKTHTSETKSKIGKSNSGKNNGHFGKQAKNIKTVIQIDKNDNIIKEWMSITIASVECNIGRNCITNTCSGRQKSAGGYVWKYKE